MKWNFPHPRRMFDFSTEFKTGECIGKDWQPAMFFFEEDKWVYNPYAISEDENDS